MTSCSKFQIILDFETYRTVTWNRTIQTVRYVYVLLYIKIFRWYIIILSVWIIVVYNFNGKLGKNKKQT